MVIGMTVAQKLEFDRLQNTSRKQASVSQTKYRNCSVARTLDIIEDSWTFLTLREMYYGAHRFEEIQKALSVSRATLTERLKRLVDDGLLDRVGYGESGNRFEYRLTDKGLDIYPVILALLKWGDSWLLNEGESPPLSLIHATCGKAINPKIVCSACSEDIYVHEATYRDGPGAGFDAEPARKQNRRSAKSLGSRLGKACSVGRSLDIIGDRWTFIVMRETFFGVRRYDEFQSSLGIATNILSDRLGKLVAAGLLRKEKYQDKPRRYEYRQTDMGADLYGAYLTMIAWADRWCAEDVGLPLILNHNKCGQDFSAKVVCNHCGDVLNARDVDRA